MPDLRIGTFAFTAAGWPGSFYPEGLPEGEYALLPKRNHLGTHISDTQKIQFPIDILVSHLDRFGRQALGLSCRQMRSCSSAGRIRRSSIGRNPTAQMKF